MTLQELSESINLSLSATLARFGGNQSLFLRFLRRFPSDATWQQLCDAAQKQDYQQIEVSAHTLKGVSANLGLDTFSQLCNEIVSSVRTSQYDTLPGLIQQASTCYDQICQAIGQLDDTQ